MPGGDLIRTGVTGTSFAVAGAGGLVEAQSWEGQPLWSFSYSDASHRLHHDLEPLPNGNLLLLAWEAKSLAETTAAGRDPTTVDAGDGVWPDTVVELDPSTSTIVWEWRVWDHLVQDFDPLAPNYDDVAARPERIDLNYVDPYIIAIAGQRRADWNHLNGIGYNAELDQIVLSAHHFHEIWVIDHSTTTAQAASSAGGDGGRGGDLLYRWGNPAAYQAGDFADQKLFHQHDPRWIPEGFPGAGDITIFNNGLAQERPYTTVVQITPPLAGDGGYLLTGSTYGPEAPSWEYIGDPPESFYSEIVGSAQRLSNGDTLINQGINGRFFIVSPEGSTVWQRVHNQLIFRVDAFTADDPALADRPLPPLDPG